MNSSATAAHRFVVFGNSGSGKSTYAKRLTQRLHCDHMDLDTVAWSPEHATPTRRVFDESRVLIERFIRAKDHWVVEGCYADLLGVAMTHATHVVFLNPGIETCIENASNRPWEPHKYVSPEAQDNNLNMLLDWIRAYYERHDEFSYESHRRLYDGTTLNKQELHSNDWPPIA